MLERGKKYWVDQRGNHIPLRHIKPVDKKKHATVEKVFSRLELLEKKILKEKSTINETIEKYLGYLSAINKNEIKETGSFTLTNFSGTKQIIIKSSDVIKFDEQILFAITKIKNCLLRWSSNSHPNLSLITSQIFKIEQTGTINRNFLLSLLRYDIKEKEWLEAVEIIKQSIEIVSKREYMIFRERNTTKEKWQTKKLNPGSLQEGK